MNSRKNIQRELELYNSSLPFDVRMPVFDLPGGYFENFAAAVLAKIKGQTADTAAEELAELSPLLAGLSKKAPYSLPDNYFATTFVPEAVKDEDPAPAWGAEGHNMPYSVPAGYFDQLPASILKQAAPSGAKVVSMGFRKWMPYAAAAALTGLLVLGAVLYNGNETTPNAASQPEGWVAKQLHNVSNQELEAFIRTTSIIEKEPVQQTASNRGEVKKLLRDVPSSELDAFLSQLPVGTEQIN